ncbi:MAG: ATP synthase F1 subunit delta [Pseudomonadota bacterium]|nr:ATP synthase F1 subunit delta [Pseudomonadota bacterium]
MNIAKRYARGLFALGGYERATTLAELGEAFANPAVAAIWANPAVSASKRKQLLANIIAAIAPDDTYLKRFCMLLQEQNRVNFLPAIARVYQQLVKEQQGIVAVEVQSAKTLTADEQQDINTAMQTKLNAKLEINFSVNPTLLGGIIVRWNHYMLDFSLKSELRAIVQYAGK